MAVLEAQAGMQQCSSAATPAHFHLLVPDVIVISNACGPVRRTVVLLVSPYLRTAAPFKRELPPLTDGLR